jgi:hypothetical protein
VGSGSIDAEVAERMMIMSRQIMRKPSVKDLTYSVIGGAWGSLTLVERLHHTDGSTIPRCLGRFIGRVRLPDNVNKEGTIRKFLAQIKDKHGPDVKYVVGFEPLEMFIKSCENCFFYMPGNPRRDEFVRFKIDHSMFQRALFG